MIVDFDEVTDDLLRDAAICIIGAGAAGITLACELDGLGKRVVLLEAGGRRTRVSATAPHYAGTATSPHANPQEFRRSGLGGTTRIWGGRCVPFDPIDFEKREYVPDSGWPISYDEVARHYPRALEYCHAGAFEYSIAGSIDGASATIPGLGAETDGLLDRIERYSLPTDFGREYQTKLARSHNVVVVLNARCVALRQCAGDSRIESVHVVGRHTTEKKTIAARNFVVSMGGIETARLLLVSESDQGGLGNGHDLVGRYYACHFEKICAALIAPGIPVSFEFERTRDGVYSRRKIQFAPQAQRADRLLNAVFRLHFPEYSDASHRSGVMSTIFLAKAALIPEYRNILAHGRDTTASPSIRPHVRNVLMGMPQVMRFGVDWIHRRVLARRKLPYTLIPSAEGIYPLEFNSEQMPLPYNRVVLTNQTGLDGMRQVHVDWRISEADVAASVRAFSRFKRVVEQNTRCRVAFDEEMLESSLRQSVPVGGHHMGTVRMGNSPREGVVDRNCAVFGHPNVFIASAAVFPTNSHANPTLTIVAMAIRLAKHLRDEVS